MENGLAITGDDKGGGGEQGGTAMVTQLTNGEQGASGKGGKKVTGSSGRGQNGDSKGSRVG
jgi:hypothetical protein